MNAATICRQHLMIRSAAWAHVVHERYVSDKTLRKVASVCEVNLMEFLNASKGEGLHYDEAMKILAETQQEIRTMLRHEDGSNGHGR